MGLTCDTEDIEWEDIPPGGFASCNGGTHTENWDAPGNYVYRAKLGQKTQKDSGCEDCDRFNGVEFECFMITVLNSCTWQSETAWADGDRYVPQGNWATYTTYQDDEDVIVYAGQTIDAGTVAFSAIDGDGNVTITITLNDNVRLQDDDESVKIQGYDTPPSGNPQLGQFTTYKGDQLIITVPYFAYYGIHLDVEVCL